jgi:hypothetical protein
MELEHTSAAAGALGQMDFNLLLCFRPRTGYRFPVMFDLSVGQVLKLLSQFAHLAPYSWLT